MGRPNRLLRWGHDPSAILVEPASGKAAVGYLDGELVPAGWLNTHLHLAGAWIGYLRGPNLGNWTRAAHGALDPFDAGKLFGLAADTATVDTDVPVYRYAAIGEVSASPALRVSRRGIGAGWVARALPVMSGESRGVAFVGRWVVWGEAIGELWSTIADDQSGNSAIGTNDATKWSQVTEAAAMTPTCAAWCAGATGRAAGARHAVVAGESTYNILALLVSTDSGATWIARSTAWANNGYTGDLAYDATRDMFVAVNGTSSLAVSISGAPASAWVMKSGPGTLSGGAAFKIRCGGGTWITFAEVAAPFTTPVAYRTRDAGDSWESLTATLPRAPGSSDPVVLRDLAYADGVWVMAVEDAPYLYASHDDGDTWERVVLPVGEEAAWALHRVIYADGQVLASGLGFCVASGRAMATADGTLVPDTTPSILSDAYRLRGRLIYNATPNDGDVYAWNAGTSRWEPTAPSAAAGMPWSSTVEPTEVTTSDATVTTLATIACPLDRLYTLDLLVSAREASRAFSVAWRLLVTVSSDGAAATVEDVLVVGPTDGGASGCSVTVDASGTNARVRITGLGGTSITWGVQGAVQRIGS